MKRFILIFVAGVISGLFFPKPILAQGCVDLGLSVNWATCNVGANTPEEEGTLFVGGQVEEYPSHVTSKYLRDLKKRILIHTQEYSGNPDYDAATRYMGSPYRIPKAHEWEELLSRCIWRWCQYRNAAGVLVRGYEIIGPNGNSIFLPAGVNRKNGKYLKVNYYECTTPVPNTKKTHLMLFWGNKRKLFKTSMEQKTTVVLGMAVRAVVDKE